VTDDPAPLPANPPASRRRAWFDVMSHPVFVIPIAFGAGFALSTRFTHDYVPSNEVASLRDQLHATEAELAKVDKARLAATARADWEAARATREKSRADSAEESRRLAEVKLASTTLDLSSLQGKCATLIPYDAALDRLASTPVSGWCILGEPCHDHEEYQHPEYHNCTLKRADGAAGPLGANTTAVVNEFLTVWPIPPQRNDKDCYGAFAGLEAMLEADSCEYYPPEVSERGILVPGQHVLIRDVFPIVLGPTFVQYELLPNP